MVRGSSPAVFKSRRLAAECLRCSSHQSVLGLRVSVLATLNYVRSHRNELEGEVLLYNLTNQNCSNNETDETKVAVPLGVETFLCFFFSPPQHTKRYNTYHCHQWVTKTDLIMDEGTR